MKIALTHTKTERTEVNKEITNESIEDWFLEFDLGENFALERESMVSLFEQLINRGNVQLKFQE